MQLTPTRLAWLEHLEKYGESLWDDMPKRKPSNGCFGYGGVSSVTNATWRPMADAGLIETQCYMPRGCYKHGRYFKITEAGRAALADAKGQASD